MIPNRIRNAALTDVPMMLPTVLKLPKRLDTAAAVAATTMQVMTTILTLLAGSYEVLIDDLRRMAEREECSYGDWFLAACKKSAGHEVDGLYRTCKSKALCGNEGERSYRDMVCVEGMTQP